MLAGVGLYVIGAIVVTIARNVPLNEALDRVWLEDLDAESRWIGFVADWTA